MWQADDRCVLLMVKKRCDKQMTAVLLMVKKRCDKQMTAVFC